MREKKNVTGILLICHFSMIFCEKEIYIYVYETAPLMFIFWGINVFLKRGTSVEIRAQLTLIMIFVEQFKTFSNLFFPFTSESGFLNDKIIQF